MWRLATVFEEGARDTLFKKLIAKEQNPGDYGARANIMWCGTIAQQRPRWCGCEKIGLRIFWNMKSVRFTTLRMAPDCL